MARRAFGEKAFGAGEADALASAGDQTICLEVGGPLAIGVLPRRHKEQEGALRPRGLRPGAAARGGEVPARPQQGRKLGRMRGRIAVACALAPADRAHRVDRERAVSADAAERETLQYATAAGASTWIVPVLPDRRYRQQSVERRRRTGASTYPRADQNLSVACLSSPRPPWASTATVIPKHLLFNLDRPRDVPLPVHHDDGGRLDSISDPPEVEGAARYLLKAGSCGPTISGAREPGMWESNPSGAPVGRISHRRSRFAHPLFTAFIRSSRPANLVDQCLVRTWRSDLRAGLRQRDAARARHPGPSRSRHGPHHAQHGLRRFLRARRRQPAVLPEVLGARLCLGVNVLLYAMSH